jgi:hypothetical protein
MLRHHKDKNPTWISSSGRGDGNDSIGTLSIQDLLTIYYCCQTNILEVPLRRAVPQRWTRTLVIIMIGTESIDACLPVQYNPNILRQQVTDCCLLSLDFQPRIKQVNIDAQGYWCTWWFSPHQQHTASFENDASRNSPL